MSETYSDFDKLEALTRLYSLAVRDVLWTTYAGQSELVNMTKNILEGKKIRYDIRKYQTTKFALFMRRNPLLRAQLKDWVIFIEN